MTTEELQMVDLDRDAADPFRSVLATPVQREQEALTYLRQLITRHLSGYAKAVDLGEQATHVVIHITVRIP